MTPKQVWTAATSKDKASTFLHSNTTYDFLHGH